MEKKLEKVKKGGLDIIKMIISYFIASIISMSVFFIGNNEHVLPKIQRIFTNTNILLFVIAIIAFCSTFIICYTILQKTIKNNVLSNKFLPASLSASIIAFSSLMFLLAAWILSENSTKMVGYIPIDQFNIKDAFYIVSILCLLVFLFCKILFKKVEIRNRKFWIIIAIMAAVLIAYFFYAPNGFLNTINYDVNYDAYYHSIYIHTQGIPYSEYFTSFYGHYAILLRPIFSIIGVSPYSMAIVTALISFISSLGIIYVMYKLVKNTFLRLLGICVVIFPFIGLLASQYPQAYPHRLLFPSIIMVIATMLLNNINNKRKVLLSLGYAISALAIIWNNDTGIICLIAWIALHLYIIITQNLFKKNDLIKLLIPIALGLISFLAAWMLTNIYNVIIGGQTLSLYYFLFPLLENSYMYGALHLDMPLYLTTWVPMFLIFMLFLGYGVLSVFIKSKHSKFDKKTALWLFIAILGIGQFIYFINRCAYSNVILGYYEAILLLLVISQKTINYSLTKRKNIPQMFKTVIFCCSLVALICISTLMIVNVVSKVKDVIQYSDMSSLDTASSYYKKIAPKDTPIVSVDSTSLGSYLGWKNELGFMDIPNLFTNENKEYVIHRLINYKKPFLIDKTYLSYLKTIDCVQYLDDCIRFRDIENEYTIVNYNDPIEYNLDSSRRLLYLEPKNAI